MSDRLAMNCEEFEMVGLDFDREGSLNEEGRERASQHARACAKCAALHSSWGAAQLELRALGATTRELGVPSRIETRVLQQFRMKHQARRDRRTIKFAVWAVGAAAMIVFTLGIWNLHQWHLRSLAKIAPQNSSPGIDAAKPSVAQVGAGISAADNSSGALSASNFSGSDAGDFTQLPGAGFYESDGSAVVRLAMQRAALAGFGLPVNEEAAGDWIQVDVLVAGDGSPQAVRLLQ